jgi:hypothetical protein
MIPTSGSEMKYDEVELSIFHPGERDKAEVFQRESSIV